jgi:choline dehydrogenase
MRSGFSLCALVVTTQAAASPFGSAAYSNHFGRAGTNATYDCMFTHCGL